MSLATLPGWATGLIAVARVAHLAHTDDEGNPRVLPVTFAAAEGAVWSAIDRKPKRTSEPARVRWLRERPQAALCIDVYRDDWQQLAWVQLLGRVTIVAAGDAPAAMGALREKYEPYAHEAPPGPLLRLEVERALSWRAADPPDSTHRLPTM